MRACVCAYAWVCVRVRACACVLVCMRLRRPLDAGTGIEYTIVLKRGAWGAEHAVVSPEDRDMLDKQRCRMCLAYMCAYMCAFMCAYLFALYDLLICVRGP